MGSACSIDAGIHSSHARANSAQNGILAVNKSVIHDTLQYFGRRHRVIQACLGYRDQNPDEGICDRLRWMPEPEERHCIETSERPGDIDAVGRRGMICNECGRRANARCARTTLR